MIGFVRWWDLGCMSKSKGADDLWLATYVFDLFLRSTPLD